MNVYRTREILKTCSIFDLKLKVAFYARVSIGSEDRRCKKKSIIERGKQGCSEYFFLNKFSERHAVFYRKINYVDGCEKEFNYTYAFAI